MFDPTSQHAYENLRILVLEDEWYIRQIICRLLRQIGFQLIDEAENGVDGFREILRVRPHLILCDIHMEPVDGITFLRKLRALGHEQLSQVPVIFLTSDKQRETVLAAKELRVDGYLAKPVSLATLKDRIDHVLLQRQGG
ncbi:response regulator [Thalassobaculum fulvum]|jgi:two-component system chemotaxis response regulator CheY|uniref:Response regulator n=1 Tax=Thalassobaculum fulvum TaxID=1633335 RepID=A0A918XYL1_9PROT|nr:response regulator [Thalassobaculum fulvum]GHD63008.1 response regulator [Thalassobaculum fulvum]